MPYNQRVRYFLVYLCTGTPYGRSILVKSGQKSAKVKPVPYSQVSCWMLNMESRPSIVEHIHYVTLFQDLTAITHNHATNIRHPSTTKLNKDSVLTQTVNLSWPNIWRNTNDKLIHRNTEMLAV